MWLRYQQIKRVTQLCDGYSITKQEYKDGKKKEFNGRFWFVRKSFSYDTPYMGCSVKRKCPINCTRDDADWIWHKDEKGNWV